MSLPSIKSCHRYRLVWQCKYWSKNYHRNESRHQPISHRAGDEDSICQKPRPRVTIGFAVVHCVYLLCGSMDSLRIILVYDTVSISLLFVALLIESRSSREVFSPCAEILLIVLKVVLNIVLWDQSDWSTSFLPLNLRRNHVCASQVENIGDWAQPDTPPKWCFPFAKECDIGAMNRVNEWNTRKRYWKILISFQLKSSKKYDITPPELRSRSTPSTYGNRFTFCHPNHMDGEPIDVIHKLPHPKRKNIWTEANSTRRSSWRIRWWKFK